MEEGSTWFETKRSGGNWELWCRFGRFEWKKRIKQTPDRRTFKTFQM